MKNGYTVIEMVVYVAVFAVVITISTSFLINLVDIETSLKAKRTVRENATYALGRISDEIRNAASVDAASSTFNSNLALGGQVILNMQDESTTTISVSSNKINLATAGNPATAITSETVSVDNLTFLFKELTNSNVLDITIDLEYKAKEKLKAPLSINTSVSLRQ